MIEVHEMYESHPQSICLSKEGTASRNHPRYSTRTEEGGGTCDTDRQAREERVVEALPFTLLLSLCSYCFMGLLVKMAKRKRE